MARAHACGSWWGSWHLLGFAQPGLEKEFWATFATTRLSSTKKFLLLHLAATLAYVNTVASPLAWAVGWTGAILPLLYLLPGLSNAQRMAWRTPVALVVRLSLAYVSAHRFTTDTLTTVQPLPLLALKMLISARVMALFCSGLGLQLPLALDVPVQLLAVAASAASAIPRQCPAPGGLGALPTLFRLHQPAFQLVADTLDMPMFLFAPNPDILALPEQALCVAVYAWTQLVLAFGVPTAVLWAAERQERRRFLEQRQQGERTVPGGGNSGTSAAAAAAEPSMSTRAADSSPLVCFPYVAALAWCLIRTACQLSMRE